MEYLLLPHQYLVLQVLLYHQNQLELLLILDVLLWVLYQSYTHQHHRHRPNQCMMAQHQFLKHHLHHQLQHIQQLLKSKLVQ